MTDAKRDDNMVTTALGASNADAETPVRLQADADHILQVSDGSSGSDFGDDIIQRDTNGVPVLAAASSSDGTTPVVLYADPSTKELLIKST